MEAARTPSPRDQLELSMLEGQQEELTPLNSLRIQPSSAESSSPAQTDKESPWSPCNKIVVGKCKLWMVIVTIFVCFAIVIIISLCLVGVTYIDEDENEILELSSNKTFFIVFKIPEDCVNEEELHHSLTKRLTDTYKESPALSRYFTCADIVDFREFLTLDQDWLKRNLKVLFAVSVAGLTAVVGSCGKAHRTTSLKLLPFFGVPAEDDGFMEYMMSEELVLGIMRQNLHDKNISSCESLGLDPESLLLYE